MTNPAKAQRFDFLLSQVRTSIGLVDGGQVYFYAAGTDTVKSVWLEPTMDNVAANPYDLNVDGTAQVYGYGDYRVVIKDNLGVTKFDYDNLYQFNPTFAYGLTDADIVGIQAAIDAAAAAEQSATEAAASAASAVNSPGTSATSTTSLTVGAAEQTLTIQTGKYFSIGQFVIIARTADPTSYMIGQISSYNGSTGELIVDVVSIGEVGGTYDAWTISLTAVSLAKAGLRNKIANGAMRIAQRGPTYALTTSIAYGSLDRWAANMASSAAGEFNQVTGSGVFQYFAQLGRTPASVLTGAISMYTALESVDSIPLRGKAITLSFYAKAGDNFSAAAGLLSIKLYTGTGTDQSASTLGSWTGSQTPISVSQAISSTLTRYNFSCTLDASINQVGLELSYTPVGTAGADDNIYITGVQLEEGYSPTEFEHISYTHELNACKRFFERVQPNGGGGSPYCACGATTAARVWGMVVYQGKRVAPTISTPDSTAFRLFLPRTGSSTIECSNDMAFSAAGVDAAFVYVTAVTSPFYVGDVVFLKNDDSSTSCIDVSADI